MVPVTDSVPVWLTAPALVTPRFPAAIVAPRVTDPVAVTATLVPERLFVVISPPKIPIGPPLAVMVPPAPWRTPAPPPKALPVIVMAPFVALTLTPVSTTPVPFVAAPIPVIVMAPLPMVLIWAPEYVSTPLPLATPLLPRRLILPPPAFRMVLALVLMPAVMVPLRLIELPQAADTAGSLPPPMMILPPLVEIVTPVPIAMAPDRLASLSLLKVMFPPLVLMLLLLATTMLPAALTSSAEPAVIAVRFAFRLTFPAAFTVRLPEPPQVSTLARVMSLAALPVPVMVRVPTAMSYPCWLL